MKQLMVLAFLFVSSVCHFPLFPETSVTPFLTELSSSVPLKKKEDFPVKDLLDPVIAANTLSVLTAEEVQEKPIVVVIPSYNNAKWCEKNLRSILNQNYKNFRVIYIDDHSVDNTKELVECLVKQYIEENKKTFQLISFSEDCSGDISEVALAFKQKVNRNLSFFTLISNQFRCGALTNQYRAISSCKDEEIIVLVDGDDWLAHDHVFEKLNEVYQNNHVWLTHGSLEEYPSGIQAWCEPVPQEIIQSNAFRKFKCPSHLRTFYAWLFKKIALNDLLYQGKFFSMTSDMAIMFPMIEMSGERHAFLSEAIYIYNMINPINDNKVDAELQRNLDFYIRYQPPYQRLEKKADVALPLIESLDLEEGDNSLEESSKTFEENSKIDSPVEDTGEILEGSTEEVVFKGKNWVYLKNLSVSDSLFLYRVSSSCKVFESGMNYRT